VLKNKKDQKKRRLLASRRSIRNQNLKQQTKSKTSQKF